MKTLTTTLFVLLLCSFGYSQVIHPIPQDSTSEWRIMQQQWDPLYYYNTYDGRVFFAGDTAFNGHSYSKLLWSGLNTIDNYGGSSSYPFENWLYAFIRTDSARTFVSFFGEEEQLLYDFTLQPGDTLPETIINHNTVVISSIDSVLVGDKYLKRFNIYDSVYEDLLSHWYIEGIGHEFGLVEPMYMMLDNGNWFQCYAENGIPIFNPEGNPCDLTVDVKESAVNNQELSVYPNPSNGIFKLAYYSRLEKDVQLKIVGLMGNVIFNNTWHLKSGLNNKSFDLPEANTGLYFVIIQDGISTVQKKVFIAN
jgi:hypothetical protein